MPQRKAVVEQPDNRLWVNAPPFLHKVWLQVGHETDSHLIYLTPSEARRAAIALLEAAEALDSRS